MDPLELGGGLTPGATTGTGAIATTTAAGGLAAAGGGMSIATVAVVSVLVLGGAGTAGYFIYDYLSEPDFHEEVYWTENGIGLSFGEESLEYNLAQLVESCDYYNDLEAEENGYGEFVEEDDLCVATVNFHTYELEEDDDYYRVCIKEYEEADLDCVEVHPREKGVIIVNDEDDYCDVGVSAIDNPSFSPYSSVEEGAEVIAEWQEDFFAISEEISEDNPPSGCQFNIGNTVEDSPQLDTYSFKAIDHSDTLSNSTNGSLVNVMMQQGSDINWAEIIIKISVDGASSMNCYSQVQDDGCHFSIDGDQYWSVGEEITISEGNQTDLCSGPGPCDIDITITKTGSGSDKVIASINALAE